MSVQWGDVPTWGLFAGAVVTAIYAMRAFSKQSKELTTLQQQAEDGQTLISQQAELIKIHAGQLAEQRKVTDKQIGVLERQAKDLDDSLEARRLQRRDQANRVLVVLAHGPDVSGSQVQDVSGFPRGEVVTLKVRNKSDLAIREVRATWNLGSGPPDEVVLTPVLGPRAEISDSRPVPPGANPDSFGAVVYFRDAAWQHWRVYPDGTLQEIHPDYL